MSPQLNDSDCDIEMKNVAASKTQFADSLPARLSE